MPTKTAPPTAPPSNKHQARTLETRALLLDAAEKVFARDGYEAADLNEIAALAGRTRGAIYAQFKSKEEVFLELVKAQRDQKRQRMQELLASASSKEENLDVLQRFFVEMLEDSTWVMLLLEFKLFTLRHPDARQELQSIFAESFTVNDEKRYARILGSGRSVGISRVHAVQMMVPIMSGIIIEMSFSEIPISRPEVLRIVNRIFNALFRPQE